MRLTSLTPALFTLLLTGANTCQRERHIHPRGLHKRQASTPVSASFEEQTLIDSFSSVSIDQWSYYYTHGDHVAGRNRSQAQWTADRWGESGLDSSVVSYNVYLNYPISKSLILTYPNGSVFTPLLEEAKLEEDDTTTWENRIPTFHGYFASGSVSAEYVYVGRGQQVGFDRLAELGVELEGKIALSRYGGPFRGLKVKNAQEHGMIGAVLFTDPADDGNITEANGYAAYPDGPARNPTAVQRGSVQFLSTYPGDPTTPGYPSREDSPRADSGLVTPHIPSIPISYVDAIPLLAALDGYGTDGETVNRTNWVGALNVTYSTGPSPGAVIDMSNYMEDTYTDIWDAIGVINGTNADETIVIGNHRDAWIIGGAADPNSGTAIVVEMGRALGRLLDQGWKPTRNIVMCSWDAEEYGLLGSTEWVEEYIPWLTDTAVSYLNIDVGTSGPHPSISASPELHTIATELMKKVAWPRTNQTMYDVWYEDTGGEIGVLGSGSDYTAFLHKGIGSIDLGSDSGPEDPIYHYHSDYDSYHWMTKFGDVGFQTHRAMGQYLSLLAYNLSSSPIIPFNLTNYGTQMDLYYDDLRATINSSTSTLDTSELRSAIDTFETRATEIANVEMMAKSMNDTNMATVVNHKYRDFQRGFTSQGGLPTREFYRHVIFAPGIDTGYAPVTFPGITEAVEAGNFTLAMEWVGTTSRAILAAADIIKT